MGEKASFKKATLSNIVFESKVKSQRSHQRGLNEFHELSMISSCPRPQVLDFAICIINAVVDNMNAVNLW